MLSNKYLEWKVETLHKPFADEQDFFRKNYGCTLTPFCKELFTQILDLEHRCTRLEAQERIRQQDDDS